MSLLSSYPSYKSGPPELDLPKGLFIHGSFLGEGNYALLDIEASSRIIHDRASDEPQAQRILRKPVPSRGFGPSPGTLEPLTPVTPVTATVPLLEDSKPRTNKIYWPVPLVTAILFMTGVILAIGHHAYLSSLEDKAATNQAWTNRCSLVIAFLAKSCLGSAIALAFVQLLWQSIQNTRQGLSLLAVDALFGAMESPLIFISREIWSSAVLPTILALAVWLMPLITLISPTALTVGSLIWSTNGDCSIPTLSWTHAEGLSLTDIDYSNILFQPSITALRIIDSTAQNGRQLGWPSPCGANCTYNVTFMAPAWNCERSENIDDPDAPWTSPSGGSVWFEGYGDGSNMTIADFVELEYSPIYEAGYNNNTSHFWIGATDSVDLQLAPGTTSIKDFLDLYIYRCEFFNTTYDLQVMYIDNQQYNRFLNLRHTDRIAVPNEIWQGNVGPDTAQMDVVGLYSPLVNLLSGKISRDPRSVLISDTNMALIPKLCKSYNGPMGAGQEDVFIPVLDLGPLLQELSYNVSISLLSDPKLRNVIYAVTPCTTYHTLTVWKYTRLPLILPYASAVFAASLSLLLGGRVILTTGVVRDKSFSTIVRSTRNRELDQLDPEGEESVAALPLGREVGKQRLKFSRSGMTSLASPEHEDKRMSFRLAGAHQDAKSKASPSGFTEKFAIWRRPHVRATSEGSSFLSPRLTP